MVKLKIDAVMRQKGMSMAKLSRLADLSYNTVQALCKDPDHDATIHVLAKIAEALGVKICDLLEESAPSLEQ